MICVDVDTGRVCCGCHSNMTDCTLLVLGAVFDTGANDVDYPIAFLMLMCRNLLVCGIIATFSFASVIWLPTCFRNSRFFPFVMFQIMSECRNFFIGCIITIFVRARVVCFPSDFRASRKFSVVMFKIVLKSRDFLIRGVFATFSFAGVIWLPTYFRNSRFLSFMMLQIMSECWNRLPIKEYPAIFAIQT